MSQEGRHEGCEKRGGVCDCAGRPCAVDDQELDDSDPMYWPGVPGDARRQALAAQVVTTNERLTNENARLRQQLPCVEETLREAVRIIARAENRQRTREGQDFLARARKALS